MRDSSLVFYVYFKSPTRTFSPVTGTRRSTHHLIAIRGGGKLSVEKFSPIIVLQGYYLVQKIGSRKDTSLCFHCILTDSHQLGRTERCNSMCDDTALYNLRYACRMSSTAAYF